MPAAGRAWRDRRPDAQRAATTPPKRSEVEGVDLGACGAEAEPPARPRLARPQAGRAACGHDSAEAKRGGGGGSRTRVRRPFWMHIYVRFR